MNYADARQVSTRLEGLGDEATKTADEAVVIILLLVGSTVFDR